MHLDLKYVNMAFMAVIMGLGLSFYILLGSRQP